MTQEIKVTGCEDCPFGKLKMITELVYLPHCSVADKEIESMFTATPEFCPLKTERITVSLHVEPISQ